MRLALLTDGRDGWWRGEEEGERWWRGEEEGEKWWRGEEEGERWASRTGLDWRPMISRAETILHCT